MQQKIDTWMLSRVCQVMLTFPAATVTGPFGQSSEENDGHEYSPIPFSHDQSPRDVANHSRTVVFTAAMKS